MTIARGMFLLLVTGFLRGLSSFFWLIPNGLMAAGLAVSLSAGTTWLSRKQAETLRPPEKREVVAVGLLTGLVGGGVAILLQWLLPYVRGRGEIDFGPPPTKEWALLLSAVLYGLGPQTVARRPSECGATERPCGTRNRHWSYV